MGKDLVERGASVGTHYGCDTRAQQEKEGWVVNPSRGGEPPYVGPESTAYCYLVLKEVQGT
jgi:hypothetical protein